MAHHQGPPQRDPHLTETLTLHVGPPILTSQEAHLIHILILILTLHQEEPLPPTQMAAIHRDTKDRHRVTANAPRAITILSLAQNAHTLHWMIFLRDMLILKYATRVSAWIMTLEVDLHNMEMHIVTELEDQM